MNPLSTTLITSFRQRRLIRKPHSTSSNWLGQSARVSFDTMPQRLIIFDNPEDPGNPLVLDGEAIDAAAKDPVAIGKLMVDQAWAEGADPTGGALYCERRSNQNRPQVARTALGIRPLDCGVLQSGAFNESGACAELIQEAHLPTRRWACSMSFRVSASAFSNQSVDQIR